MKSQTIRVEDYPRLLRAYNRAVKQDRDQFEFEGKTLHTAYAKYLLEYLKPLYRSHQEP